MESYLRDLAARVLRISRATMDIETGRKLRRLADDIQHKAAETTETVRGAQLGDHGGPRA